MFMLRARPVVRTLRARAHICMHLRLLIHPNSNYAMKYCAFKKDFFMFSPQFRCGDLIVDEWAKESHGNE